VEAEKGLEVGGNRPRVGLGRWFVGVRGWLPVTTPWNIDIIMEELGRNEPKYGG